MLPRKLRLGVLWVALSKSFDQAWKISRRASDRYMVRVWRKQDRKPIDENRDRKKAQKPGDLQRVISIFEPMMANDTCVHCLCLGSD